MKFIDISQTIFTGMKKYPSDPRVKVRQFKSIKKGDSCNLCKLVLGSHAGTHIDAPRHIFGKANAVDDIAIKDLICDIIVENIREILHNGFFKKINRKGIRGILLKKEKGKTILAVKEAMMLIENNIKLVGTEEMSIEGLQDKSHPVHRLLLSNGVVIIEGLDLKKVKKGSYKLICLPLKIKNGDGAPARAILIYD